MIAVNFNSHAHVERDWNTQTAGVKLEISTHTLTWSVTKHLPSHSKMPKISTHTLTWSVTGKYYWSSRNCNHFNSHAHVERDKASFLLMQS